MTTAVFCWEAQAPACHGAVCLPVPVWITPTRQTAVIGLSRGHGPPGAVRKGLTLLASPASSPLTRCLSSRSWSIAPVYLRDTHPFTVAMCRLELVFDSCAAHPFISVDVEGLPQSSTLRQNYRSEYSLLQNVSNDVDLLAHQESVTTRPPPRRPRCAGGRH